MVSAPDRLDFESDHGGIDGAAVADSSADSSAPGQVAGHQSAWAGRHPVDLRISIPLGFGRYYLTVVVGRERRDTSRRKDERRKHPLSTVGNLTFLFFLGTVGGMALLALMLFLGSLALEGLGVVVPPA